MEEWPPPTDACPLREGGCDHAPSPLPLRLCDHRPPIDVPNPVRVVDAAGRERYRVWICPEHGRAHVHVNVDAAARGDRFAPLARLPFERAQVGFDADEPPAAAAERARWWGGTAVLLREDPGVYTVVGAEIVCFRTALPGEEIESFRAVRAAPGGGVRLQARSPLNVYLLSAGRRVPHGVRFFPDDAAAARDPYELLAALDAAGAPPWHAPPIDGLTVLHTARPAPPAAAAARAAQSAPRLPPADRRRARASTAPTANPALRRRTSPVSGHRRKR